MLGVRVSRALVVCLLTVTFPLFSSSPVAATEGSDSDGWEFGAQAYVWGASIGGTSAAGDDIDISFSDIIDNLDFALMDILAAGKDKWSLFADMIYLNVEDDQNSTAKIVGIPVKTDVNVQLEGFVSTLGGAYRFMETSATSLNVLAGARYLWLEVDLEARLGNRTRDFSDSGHVWDGIVGLRGKTNLNDKWYLHYYADVGTGDSDLTWQALAGINYRFKRVDAVLGYRYLDWDFDDNEVLDDLNLSGPFAGVKFRF